MAVEIGRAVSVGVWVNGRGPGYGPGDATGTHQRRQGALHAHHAPIPACLNGGGNLVAAALADHGAHGMGDVQDLQQAAARALWLGHA